MIKCLYYEARILLRSHLLVCLHCPRTVFSKLTTTKICWNRTVKKRDLTDDKNANEHRCASMKLKIILLNVYVCTFESFVKITISHNARDYKKKTKKRTSIFAKYAAMILKLWSPYENVLKRNYHHNVRR